ncbi:hypothetical protein AncyloWKF20_19270 [Ancylobacter sp. WKF20]|uniref:hypothetical protein n=1 Tax=Ancylobacter sp. WKF20 TaxID=3039801 RepID=UPI0024343046|nr:hypothetical protein [Ancylobacter sp. WKF20]WGD29867.1 hypothetical protein AncyloWKF20_19270 [Ancylobacter sp. WKF20]
MGLADRKEICGLLAILEVTSAIQLARGTLADVTRRLGIDTAEASVRVTQIAESLSESPTPTDALRHRLWMEFGDALGATVPLPLSVRRTREAASAMGVLAAERLGRVSPEEQSQDERTSARRLWDGVADLARGLTGSRVDKAPSFPDVVAVEMKAILGGLAAISPATISDPAIVAAIQSGQTGMAAAVTAGGGWAAAAATVGATGFAPYILAAQLSAFLPFVSGPALVSFLAVMANPVTLAAGGAAGVYMLGRQAISVRATVASRLVVLLALRGFQDRQAGMADLVSAFRALPRLTPSELPHLSRQQLTDLRAKHQAVEQKLGRPLPPAHQAPPGSWGQMLEPRKGAPEIDEVVLGGLTAGDMLFHAAAIDPTVLSAADFVRTLELTCPLDLAAHVSAFMSSGARIQLRGYTAEQVVMARLIDEGHAVELAANSTMPGFDLIVDGLPVQVKCGTSLSLLEHHFATYPDIPVIADNELAAMAVAGGKWWADRVTTVDGFDLGTVEELVSRTLVAAEALASPDLPLFAAIVGLGRGGIKAAKGEIPLNDLPSWLLIDLSIRSGLAAAGKLGGSLIGLIAIGPAGALILGSVVGVAALVGRHQARDLVDRALHAEWHASVVAAAADLRLALHTTYERQAKELLLRHARMMSASGELNAPLASWLERRALDDTVAALEALDELPSATDVRSAFDLLMHAARCVAPDSRVIEARAELIARLSNKPTDRAGASKLFNVARDTMRRTKILQD